MTSDVKLLFLMHKKSRVLSSPSIFVNPDYSHICGKLLNRVRVFFMSEFMLLSSGVCGN